MDSSHKPQRKWTEIKAENAWTMFKVVAEFVEGLSVYHPQSRVFVNTCNELAVRRNLHFPHFWQCAKSLATPDVPQSGHGPTVTRNEVSAAAQKTNSYDVIK